MIYSKFLILLNTKDIIRKFNPNVHGFSTGTGKNTASNAVFNVAHPGDTSQYFFK